MEKTDFLIELKDRIDSKNAADTEAGITAILDKNSGMIPVFDASNLTYISSAGLRVLMKISRLFAEKLTIRDVSPEIYEIFDTTGFTSLFDIKKRLRNISVEGCRIIGKGAFGTVYRLDDDTIVKVYQPDLEDALSIIENEKELAKKGFVAGIPTAISFDVVKVGASYGAVFELLNAKTFNDLIIEEPDKADETIKRYTDLIKSVHSIEMKPGELPSSREKYLDRLNVIRDHISGEVFDKLHSLIFDLPEDLHVVHGDIQMKNVMLSEDEPMLIDMDNLSIGLPIFDLQAIYVCYQAFLEDEPDNGLKFLGISQEMCNRIWDGIIENYYTDRTEEERALICDKIRVLAYIRFLQMMVISDDQNNELTRLRIKHSIEHLNDLSGRISDLTI
ncbi:MAG: phosphotransferase [Lachnospiraceae bacterium]|nr:phosphotransferase [Lachnospiraceae bacterium]